MLALKTAREAKIAVNQGCLDRCEQFFKSCERPDGRTAYQQAGNVQTEATTGVGMLVHEFLLHKPDSPLVKLAAPYLAGYAERTFVVQASRLPVTVAKGRGRKKRAWQKNIDYYLWYNCTLAMYQAGGDAWERWNDLIRDRLEDLQIDEGCARGSWDPADRWGVSGGGRIYSTALAVPHAGGLTTAMPSKPARRCVRHTPCGLLKSRTDQLSFHIRFLFPSGWLRPDAESVPLP